MVRSTYILIWGLILEIALVFLTNLQKTSQLFQFLNIDIVERKNILYICITFILIWFLLNQIY